MRAIFDYLSVAYKIAIPQKYINNLPKDSYNDLLNFIEKGKANGIIPKEISSVFLYYKKVFEYIKTVRDLIIHKGKEPIIALDENKNYLISLRFKENELEYDEELKKRINYNDEIEGYPIIEYLSKLTNDTLELVANLGIAIYHELKLNTLYLSAYEGICIPEFIKLLRVTNEEV